MATTATTTSFVHQVEEALNRMFDPSTSNDVKQQIQVSLDELKRHPDVLVQCYHLLSLSQNQYVMWFGVSVLEEIVNDQWSNLSLADQSTMKEFLLSQLLQSHSRPPFVTTKLSVVFVSIGKQDWPHRYPTFLSQIESFLTSASTYRLGLSLLRLCAEEFGRENDSTIVMERKIQLKQSLVTQLPSIVASLASILQSCLSVLRKPSPEQQQQQSVSAIMEEHDAFASLALGTLIQFLEWAPLGNYLSPNLVSLVFQFTILRRNAATSGTSSCVSPSLYMSNASLGALECITQMMCNKCIPQEFEAYLAQLTSSLIAILQGVLGSSGASSSTFSPDTKVMDLVGEEYLDKVTEFINVFLDQHMNRIERHPGFELNDFLQLLLQYTCSQPHSIGFINSLNLWIGFLTYVEESEQLDRCDESKLPTLQVYENGLCSLAFHILNRVQYQFNASQLEELDDEEPNDDDDGGDDGQQQNEVSELEEFHNECINLIIRIAELPSCARRLLDQTIPSLQTKLGTIYQIHASEPPLQDTNDAQNQVYLIRDTTAFVRIISSIGGKYYRSVICNDSTAAAYVNGISEGQKCLQMFIQLAKYQTEHRFHSRGNHFGLLQCASLDAVRLTIGCVVLPLSNTDHSTSQSSDQLQAIVSEATEMSIQIILMVIDCSIVPSPIRIMNSAMDVLLSIAWTIPSDILHGRCHSMTHLKDNVHSISLALPFSIQEKLYTALSHALLPGSLNIRSSEWHSRQQAYRAFTSALHLSMTGMVQLLQQSPERMAESSVVTQLQRDMIIVAALGKAVKCSPKPAKEAFYALVEPVILPSSLMVMSMYMKSWNSSSSSTTTTHVANKVTNAVIQMLISIVEAIRREIPTPNVREIISTFLQLFQHVQTVSQFNAGGKSETLLFGRFMNLLHILIEEATSVFKSFHQSILDLCFDSMRALIFESPHRELLLPDFLSMMESFLFQHYRFFVTSTMNADGIREKSFTSDQAYQYFLTIFQSIGQVLKTAESFSPQIVKQILKLLNKVNEGHHLYQLPAFQSVMRSQYVEVLFQHLLSGKMDLLREELSDVLYQIVSSDFNWFHYTFLPHFCSNTIPNEIMPSSANTVAAMEHLQQIFQPSSSSSSSSSSSNTNDRPTFIQLVNHFIMDFRCIVRTTNPSSRPQT